MRELCRSLLLLLVFVAYILLSHKSCDSAVIIVSALHNAPPVCALVFILLSSVQSEILGCLRLSLFIRPHEKTTEQNSERDSGMLQLIRDSDSFVSLNTGCV